MLIEYICEWIELMCCLLFQCHRLMRWCPAPDCTYAAKVTHTAEAVSIKCKCGHVFCFKCSERWHEPIRYREKTLSRDVKF